jgi:hypothetical protein
MVTRTFRVSSESSLYLLHQIIQVVMGWRNTHLYEFSIDTLRFMDTRLVDEDFEDVTDVKSVMLEDVFPRVGAKAHYLYDFGDGWMHHLELIDINHLPQNEVLPSFISAQIACPPEDCGGGYSATKYPTIPLQSTPPIPLQSTPRFRYKGHQLLRSKVPHFVS